MISLKDKRTELMNLNMTIETLEQFDDLIKYYSEDKPGPAYLTVRYVWDNPEIQISRAVFLEALKAQRGILVNYLASMGIDANA